MFIMKIEHIVKTLGDKVRGIDFETRNVERILLLFTKNQNKSLQ